MRDHPAQISWKLEVWKRNVWCKFRLHSRPGNWWLNRQLRWDLASAQLLFMMFLTILSSLHWSWARWNRVRSGLPVNRTATSTNCGSHVKRVLTLSDVLTLMLAFSLSARCWGWGKVLQTSPQYLARVLPTSRERSVWRNKKPKKRIAFSEEDRPLACSLSISGSLEPTILSKILPTYSKLFFEIMIRNSIRNGTKFCYRWHKYPSDDILEELYKLRIRESEKLKTVLELCNMEIHQKRDKAWTKKSWRLLAMES